MVSLRQGRRIRNRGDEGEEGLVEDRYSVPDTQSAVLTAEKDARQTTRTRTPLTLYVFSKASSSKARHELQLFRARRWFPEAVSIKDNRQELGCVYTWLK